MPYTQGLTPNLAAFLDTIAFSEIGPALIALSDNGYNVEVGSTAHNPILFSDYTNHPHVLDTALDSTAAGRYQIIWPTFEDYKAILGLPDFSPASQDAIAMQLIRECKAQIFINEGQLNNAIFLCSRRWASFPGSTSGQPQRKMATLAAAYLAAGGTMAPQGTA